MTFIFIIEIVISFLFLMFIFVNYVNSLITLALSSIHDICDSQRKSLLLM